MLKWLNGKKTYIGAALGFVTALFVLATGEQVTVATLPTNLEGWLALLTAVVTGAGFMHKGLKAAGIGGESGESGETADKAGE